MLNNECMADAIKNTRELREHLLNDRYRPGYHFVIPEDVGMPGDPNGAFYANGRYHLMYLYDRRGETSWNNHCFAWGHISSCDLIHWRHHPDAILPGGSDGGCFSGGAFLDDDGTAYLSYWALPFKGEKDKGSGIAIAKSSDKLYERWEKLDENVLPCTTMGIQEITDDEGNIVYLGNADPSNIWKKDGVYYMQAGNKPVLDKYGSNDDSPIHLRGDWVDLFKSNDMINWEYVHRFYQRDINNKWTYESEDDMCPSFLPLPSNAGGGDISGKYLQLFISHNIGCQYYIGEYDKQNDLFIPETHGRMTWNDNTFFAPEALIDGNDRQIMWSWMVDNPEGGNEKSISDGWSGVYSLPRTLWLREDNTLGIAPIPELNILRYDEKNHGIITLNDGETAHLEDVNGESCEIKLSIDIKSAEKIGLKVRTSPNDEECTLLYYDVNEGSLVFDAEHSGCDGRMIKETAPFTLEDGEKLELHIYIDKSMVEIFANDRQAVTRRVYPERDDSTGIYLFCEGGNACFDDIKTWEMMPSNPY